MARCLTEKAAARPGHAPSRRRGPAGAKRGDAARRRAGPLPSKIQPPRGAATATPRSGARGAWAGHMTPACAASPAGDAPGRRAAWCGTWLLLAAALLALCGASVGSTGFDSLLRMRTDPVAWQIVCDIRLPRTLGAWLAGALLGLAGAV
ncbi:iron chelate uptake ABC transporter family permease subunit, partial [Verminephrobacter aporrectodeae]|uniref:iron chelate uptake ABC transporter family permease subunit n=1 Tax=Verminephrobacter aporrectodeae TaxID=1110389 RepID=UPI002ADEE008